MPAPTEHVAVGGTVTRGLHAPNRLRVESTDSVALGNTPDTFHQCRGSKVSPLFECRGPHTVEGVCHDLLQTGRDFALPPEILLKPLDPFEIRDNDAAGVGENVGNHRHSA